MKGFPEQHGYWSITCVVVLLVTISHVHCWSPASRVFRSETNFQKRQRVHTTREAHRTDLLDVSSRYAQSVRTVRTAQPQPTRLPQAENSAPIVAAKQQTAGTIPKLTTSLVKSIVGSGILALPAGIATLGDSPDVIPYAIAIIGAVGAMNAYYFRLIGQVCQATGSTSYREAWDRTVGAEKKEGETSASSNLVAVVVAMKTALACVAYSMILADSFQSLGIAAGLTGLTRTEALVCVTGLVLLPLSLLQDLKALAPFALLGLVGMGAAGGAICLRHLDGSYVQGGQFWDDLARVPSFGSTGPKIQGLVLACTLATAFVAHYNAPRFHSELDDNTPERFDTVVACSYGIAALTFIIVASQGFLTFGSSSSSLILNSYSSYDPLITASRAAVAASILFAFPLPFVGLRDGTLDLLRVPDEERDEGTQITLSLLLLAGVTFAATLTSDLGLVLSVGGGTLSTSIASVFPTLMYRAAATKDADKLDNPELHTKVSLGLMCISVAIGATGVWLAIDKALH